MDNEFGFEDVFEVIDALRDEGKTIELLEDGRLAVHGAAGDDIPTDAVEAVLSLPFGPQIAVYLDVERVLSGQDAVTPIAEQIPGMAASLEDWQRLLVEEVRSVKYEPPRRAA